MEELIVLIVVGCVVLGRVLEWLGVWIDGKARDAMRYPLGRRWR